jgi:hypothetical protein
MNNLVAVDLRSALLMYIVHWCDADVADMQARRIYYPRERDKRSDKPVRCSESCGTLIEEDCNRHQNTYQLATCISLEALIL